MDPIYVTGHRNPDTDSIVSAMAYAQLRSALGDGNYVAARLGRVNDETQTVLDRFGFEPPTLIHNLRNQVSDLAYDTPPVLNKAVTVDHAWQMLHQDENTVALPVADDDGTLFGMLTTNIIAAHEKYKDRNFTALGIAVNDKPEATLRAMEHDGINYPQIINSQKIATDAYGINGIPEIILFAPDGTILARGLRGNEIEKKMVEIFGE